MKSVNSSGIKTPRANLYPVSPAISLDEYVHSSLFHEVYLRNDLKTDFAKFWGRTGIAEDGFGLFFQDIKELTLKVKSLSGKKIDHNQTINDIIHPILKALGWADNCLIYSKNILAFDKTGDEISIKPTILAFRDEQACHAIQKEKSATGKHFADAVFLPVSTTYFGAWSDLKGGKHDKNREQFGKYGDIYSVLGNDEQVFNYLELLNSEWGISTDGHSWRLIKRSAFSIDHSKYFEFNLWSFLNSLATAKPHQEDALIEILKHFYWFFSKESHQNTRPNQLSLTWERSQKYSDSLEDDLRGKFVAAMSIAVNGLWKSGKSKDLQNDLHNIQDIAESFVFNTLFIRSCESRRILPLHQTYIPVSLHNLISKLRDFNPAEASISEATKVRLEAIFGRKITDEGTEIFDYLYKLFELTNDSEKKSQALGFAIEGFKENFFSRDQWITVKKLKLDNLNLAKVLTTLFYFAPNIQVPFNLITPQQFGSIFESFLEFKLSNVTDTQYLVRRKRKEKNSTVEKIDVVWISDPKASDEIIYTAKRGSLYFRPDNVDRKISGSYFTPDHIVEYIVSTTLGPILKNKSGEEILEVKVCDPAMGSGHFLISALRHLTTSYLKKCDRPQLTPTAAKRLILNKCIFGVDQNYRAVKLGKLALWLETAEPGKSLEPLDDQIKCTNSLTDINLWKHEWKVFANGLDAIVGNPPYLGEKGNRDIFKAVEQSVFGKDRYKSKMDLFYFFFHLSLDILKANGRLGFITTNYYATATGGTKLRQDLFNRSNIDVLVNLNELKVFGDAAGQHNLITILTKTNSSSPTRVINAFATGRCTEEILLNLVSGADSKATYKTLLKSDLFDGEEHYIRLNSGAAVGGSEVSDEQLDEIIRKLKNGSKNLEDHFEVEQGLHTGADKVSNKHLKSYPSLREPKGAGIFVLTENEIRDLKFSKKDMQRIQPLFKNSQVGKFKTNNDPRFWFIDFSYPKDKDVDLKNDYPKIYNHLKRFEPILKGRKDTANGMQKAIKDGIWWTIGARKKLDYSLPKIVAPQRSPLNTFGYNEIPWFASADVYFITNRSMTYDLKYILGLLNSKVYYVWFYLRGKRKGEMLELYQQPLSEAPLKDADPKEQQQIIRWVDKLIANPNDNKAFEDLNTAIYKLFKLNKTEIEAVERMYAQKARVALSITEEDDEDAA